MANDKDFKVKNGIQPTVYHEGVGTVVSNSESYSLSGASYDSKSFSVSSQDTNPRSFLFNNNGTKAYILGDTNNSVFQYSLSIAFDISTMSYDSVSFSITSQGENPSDASFNSNGTKFYYLDFTTESIFQYSLSTAYDISTISYDSVSFSVTSQEGSPRSFTFNSDGTKFYMIGSDNDTIYQYSMSTAYDLSTASYANKSFSVNSEETTPLSVVFNNDGTKLYMVGVDNDTIFQYSLSTAYDISTASYGSVSFSVLSEDTQPYDITFNNDGTKLYMIGSDNDTIYQYSTALTTNTLDLSTGSVFEITPTSDIQVGLSNPAASGTVSQATLLLDGVDIGTSYDIGGASYDSVNFSVSSQETVAAYLGFKDDGTKMYLLGFFTENIYQYNLSTAWDISTASYSNSKNFVSQETSTTAFFIKPDGTKLYLVGTTNKTVYEYNLSTAWDTNTASYANKSFSVNSQDTIPTSLFFKPDGTKMYVGGGSGEDINEYNLSTAWDVSTATYSQNYDVSSNVDGYPTGLIFTSDGSRMFVLSFSNSDISEYSLSTPWNISTASYVEAFDASTQATNMRGLSFKDDGTKMYLVSNSTDTVYQYSSGTGSTTATITYPSTLEFAGGTAPTSPAIGETDVITFSTTDGGTSYQAVQAIDGAK